jgi:hypothetical protein
MAAWSARSQRDVLRQLSLKAELVRSEKGLASAERKLAEAQADQESGVERYARGDRGIGRSIAERVADVGNAERQCAAFREHAGRLREELAALENPTAKDVDRRRQSQGRVAQLAERRSDLDRLIAGTVKELHRLLEKRGGMSAAMRDAAGAVDMTLTEDHLDESRFNALAAALPSHLAEKSECWLRWFFGGSREGTKTYAVTRGPFTLAETLASAEVYSEGQRVELTKVEAEKFLAELRPRVKETSLLEKLLVG